jgi:hypothetical protein
MNERASTRLGVVGAGESGSEERGGESRNDDAVFHDARPRARIAFHARIVGKHALTEDHRVQRDAQRADRLELLSLFEQ